MRLDVAVIEISSLRPEILRKEISDVLLIFPFRDWI
jgi:hypothetical protein